MPGLALLLLPQQFLKNYLKEGDKGGKVELTLGALPLLERVRRSGDTGLPMQSSSLPRLLLPSVLQFLEDFSWKKWGCSFHLPPPFFPSSKSVGSQSGCMS